MRSTGKPVEISREGSSFLRKVRRRNSISLSFGAVDSELTPKEQREEMDRTWALDGTSEWLNWPAPRLDLSADFAYVRY